LEQSTSRTRVAECRIGPPVYIGWRAGTTTRFLVTIDCSKIPALCSNTESTQMPTPQTTPRLQTCALLRRNPLVGN
jgi:hypothetical protein